MLYMTLGGVVTLLARVVANFTNPADASHFFLQLSAQGPTAIQLGNSRALGDRPVPASSLPCSGEPAAWEIFPSRPITTAMAS